MREEGRDRKERETREGGKERRKIRDKRKKESGKRKWKETEMK